MIRDVAFVGATDTMQGNNPYTIPSSTLSVADSIRLTLATIATAHPTVKTHVLVSSLPLAENKHVARTVFGIDVILTSPAFRPRRSRPLLFNSLSFFLFFSCSFSVFLLLCFSCCTHHAH